MIGAGEQDAGELAMRARCGLQGDGLHAGDFDERFFERAQHAERALRERFRLIGMRFGDAFQARDELVDARVVLHGAGAERIHAEIDRVVPGGEAREVADDLDLGELGQSGCFGARGVAEEFGGVCFGHVERRQPVAALAG